jgi:hypothetical protein
MTTLQKSDVFLVGSVPLEDTAEVLQVCADRVGDRVFALPDGETGARRMWIGALGELTFAKHPDLEPDPETKGPFGAYRRKPGVDTISLNGYLPYADAALSSYRTFKELREAGSIPTGIRFQVAFPTPHAAIGGYFSDVEHDWPLLQDAYREAITADVARILDEVPAEDLAIQWDYCTELCDILGAASGRYESNDTWTWNPKDSAEDKFQSFTASSYLAPLTEPVPAEVACGYHLCVGTWPQQPAVLISDLSYVVRVANAMVANTPRQVDFLHLPAIANADRDFFAPLEDLDVGDARIFIGMECGDGRQALARRAEAAREFLPSFGISHFCGYGRESHGQIPELLGDLKAVAEQMSE